MTIGIRQGAAVQATRLRKLWRSSLLITTLLAITSWTANAQTASAPPSEAPLYFFGTTAGDGGRPFANLVAGSDGLYYGTSLGRATDTGGTVFSISNTGTLTTLHRFGTVAGEGLIPQAALIQARDGMFYGTTSDGGIDNAGTVFRLTPSGSYSVVHAFISASEGAGPRAALVQGPDGAFYGSANAGGNGGAFGNNGTIFRMTADGSLSTLHAFAGPDGASPASSLIVGQDGFLYGTTQAGGANDSGTVFRVSIGGQFSVVHDFTSDDGGPGFGGLVQGTDGSFYGTTSGDSSGFSGRYGTVFRLTPSGAFTTLHRFTQTDGAYPAGGLVFGRDGQLLGATRGGGSSGAGTLFRIAPDSGALSTLHTFVIDRRNPDGRQPNGLILGPDGVFFGTTVLSTLARKVGGTKPEDEIGTVFALTVDPPAVQISVSPSITAANSAATLTWASQGATSCTASGSWRGAQATSGSVSVSQRRAGDYDYALTCSNAVGSTTATTTLHIAAAPAVSLTIAPLVVTAAKPTATLTWTSDRAIQCTATGDWSGMPALNGTIIVTPQGGGVHKYTLTCSGVGGATADSASVVRVGASP